MEETQSAEDPFEMWWCPWKKSRTVHESRPFYWDEPLLLSTL